MGDDRRIVGDILTERAVVIEPRPHRTRLRVGAQVFGDILFRYDVRAMSEGLVEPAEIDPFTPGGQGFRQIEDVVKGVVPALTGLRECLPTIARNDDVKNRQPAYRVRVSDGDRIGDRATPVVA